MRKKEIVWKEVETGTGSEREGHRGTREEYKGRKKRQSQTVKEKNLC